MFSDLCFGACLSLFHHTWQFNFLVWNCSECFPTEKTCLSSSVQNQRKPSLHRHFLIFKSLHQDYSYPEALLNDSCTIRASAGGRIVLGIKNLSFQSEMVQARTIYLHPHRAYKSFWLHIQRTPSNLAFTNKSVDRRGSFFWLGGGLFSSLTLP